MTNHLKKFSPIPFLVCILCFFFPFVNVSCGGQRVASFRGIQLVTGITIRQPELFGPPKVQRVGPEPLALIALLCAGVAGLAALMRSKAGAIVAALLGGAGAVVLLVLKAKIDNAVLKEGQGMFQVEYGSAYWLAFLLLLVGCGLNAYVFAKQMEGGFVRCSRCGVANRAGARFCTGCGQALLEIPAAPVTPPGASSDVACPQCGGRVSPSARFCQTCGRDLQAGSERSSEAPKVETSSPGPP
jgi:DNA-directed RNA polymerase subunit RPC12/RpoP